MLILLTIANLPNLKQLTIKYNVERASYISDDSAKWRYHLACLTPFPNLQSMEVMVIGCTSQDGGELILEVYTDFLMDSQEKGNLLEVACHDYDDRECLFSAPHIRPGYCSGVFVRAEQLS
jgi:hypothetical protein